MHSGPSQRSVDAPPPGTPEFDRLFTLAYEELRLIARRHLRMERAGHTLETVGLVHEAYLKLAGREGFPPEDSVRFRALVSKAMRQVLIDHARARAARKRGSGAIQVTLHPELSGAGPAPLDLLAVEEMLVRLGERDPRLERVAECRLFGGLSGEETAAALGVSTRTVERDWLRAKAYLRLLLAPEPA